MSILKMSDEEKQKIRDEHKKATENHNNKKEDLKKGLKAPEKKEVKKS